MYRALYGFMGMQGVVGEVTHAMSFAINGSLVLVCIALGVAIPNIFCEKMDCATSQGKATTYD